MISWNMPNTRVRAVSRLLYRNTGHVGTPVPTTMVKRVKKTQVSTESVDLKTPHSAKSNQAWKYPGGQILRAPSTALGSGTTAKGKAYTDHKHPEQNLPRRKQESNFFLTINSNKSPTTPEDTDRCYKAMERMLAVIADEHYMSQYIKFGPKSDHYEHDKYNDVIHSVDWKAAVETGDQLNRVHAHIWVTITHYSQIQINVHMLMHIVRQYYNEHIGSTDAHDPLRMNDNPYVHVKLLPQGDWTSVMRQYIHKGMDVK